MAIKSDIWIRKMALEQRMIEPFSEKRVKKSTLSWGISSYGYDIRLADEFKIFNKNRTEKILDPKNVDNDCFTDFRGEDCIIPANSFVLARSLEYFRIPRSVLAICTGKSSYSRCGVIVNLTPFEPTWEGTATISISNTGPSPVKVYAGEGIAQVIFFESPEVCKTAYADRRGKYNFQKEITLSK